MTPQKKRRLKSCSKCLVSLRKHNWNIYDKKAQHYICKSCRQEQDKIRKDSNPDYNRTQHKRYRERRSAVIFYYGNQCAKCQEDEYGKLTVYRINGGGVDINYLYNNLVSKNEYQVLCYNCRKKPSQDKYALKNKRAVITHYGGYCPTCNEDDISKLTLNHQVSAKFYRQLIVSGFPDLGLQVFCFNCYHSKIESDKYPLESLGQVQST